MLTVYAFGNAPRPVWPVTRDLRVLWTLEETGLPYRLKLLDFAGGELKAAPYLQVQPFGQIPAIDDGGFRLFESAAIVLYLAEKAGKLLPPDREGRALAAQWAFAAVNTLEPAAVQLFVIDHFSAEQAWAKELRPSVVTLAQARLATLDGVLAGRKYVAGDEFSAPDILVTTVLRILQHTDLLRAAPNVAAYQQRCEARPAWQKVIHEHLARLAA
jgi:glutathione S-transferase